MKIQEIKDLFTNIVSWGKKQVIALIAIVIVILVATMIKQNSSFVFVKTTGDKKIKIEVYDYAALQDSLANCDSLEVEDLSLIHI